MVGLTPTYIRTVITNQLLDLKEYKSTELNRKSLPSK